MPRESIEDDKEQAEADYITMADVAEIKKGFLDNCRNLRMTWDEIADELGENTKTLFNWPTASGYIDPCIKGKRKEPPDIREQIDSLRTLGYKWNDVSETLKVN